MYTFKLDEIEFNNGSTLTPGPITVFVGPNNVGKSRVLKDLVSHITQPDPRYVVVRSVQIPRPTNISDLRTSYEVEPFRHDAGNLTLGSLGPSLCEAGPAHAVGGPEGFSAWADRLIGDSSHRVFWQIFGPALVTYLSTEHRLQLVKAGTSPASRHQCTSLLQRFFYGGQSIEHKVSEIVEKAFHTQVALDFSSPQNLLLRLGKDFSSLPPDPRDAGPMLEAAVRLDEQGDGIRAFVGIVAAMLAIKRDIVLIDEPETFLHPPQALRMGEFLSDCTDESKQIIITTHSADVLRAMLSRNHRNVSIIRIDRTGDTNSFQRLDPARLQDLVIDPLLSSARVLEGIFYKGTVVVEADADARFYQSVSRKPADGLNLHFVNADNKQTVPRIMGIYVDLGVRCAGIVDVDVLNDATEFEKQLEGLRLEPAEFSRAMDLQNRIAKSVSAIGPLDRVSALKGGLSALFSLLPADGAEVLTEGEARAVSRSLERELHRLLEDGKPWREVKRRGREALSPQAIGDFDDLREICAKAGCL